jgi:hypothetical protein
MSRFGSMPWGGVEGEAALDEGGDRRGALIGVEFAVGQPRVVVDERVHPLVADTLALLGAAHVPVAGDGVAGPREAGEALAVDVQQIAGAGQLVQPWPLTRLAGRSRDPSPLERPPDGRVRMPVSPAISRGPQPERRLAAQIRSCSPADNSRGERCGREERSSRQASKRRCSRLACDQRRHHLQAVVGETPRRLGASLHEQPASTSATSARRPASPSRALR